MAIVDYVKKHDEIMKEAKLAWNWLIKLPEYKVDCKNRNKLKGHTLLTEGYELKKKYGFYPLINPKFKYSYHHAPLEFFVAFGELVKQHPFDSGVDFKTLDYLELDAYEHPKKYRKYSYKPRPLPRRVLIEIDPKKPINFILEQIERYLKRVKKVYKIKDNKPRVAELNLIYKNYVLENLGLKRKEVRKIIAPFTDDSNANESKRKKAYRISKKVESIRTRKL